jgi:hypothetical protein
MHSKNGRQNHDFQIMHFLAGKCGTPDGAYAVLCDLRAEREAAIAHYRVCQKRNKAKRLRLEAVITSNESDALEREADLEEMDNAEHTNKVLFGVAEDELAFINKVIAAIQPMRKYAHLPDSEAHEAMQEEEWLQELLERAENMMFCHGTPSPDELTTMRAHPAFKTEILPALIDMERAVKEGNRAALMVARKSNDGLLQVIGQQVAMLRIAP